MTKFQRRACWGLGGLLGFLILAALAARLGAGWYLQSERFRQQITSAVGHELQAEGDFLPLHFADGTFYSDGYAARGKANAFFSNLRAEQIRALVNWRGLLDRRWEIDELNVQNLEVQFGGRTPEATPVPDTKPHPPKKKSRWRLDLRRAEVAQSTWRWGTTPATTGSVTGAGFVLLPNDGEWLIEAHGGTLDQTGWPSLTIDSAKLRYAGPSLFVRESSLRNGAGHLAVTGEMRFDQLADFQAQFERIALSPLLPPDWRVRLRGELSGSAHIRAPLPAGDPQIDGDLQLQNGEIEAIPVLDAIATFTQTDRFRRVAVTRGSLAFTRVAGLTTVKNLILESEGLLRVEGSGTIANGRIDGHFQLGVTAASLQWLPGSQARVFTVAHDGYSWTPVHVSGPVDHPHEDLTKRLLAAAAGELLEKSPNDILDSAKSLLDLLPH